MWGIKAGLTLRTSKKSITNKKRWHVMFKGSFVKSGKTLKFKIEQQPSCLLVPHGVHLFPFSDLLIECREAFPMFLTMRSEFDVRRENEHG